MHGQVEYETSQHWPLAWYRVDNNCSFNVSVAVDMNGGLQSPPKSMFLQLPNFINKPLIPEGKKAAKNNGTWGDQTWTTLANHSATVLNSLGKKTSPRLLANNICIWSSGLFQCVNQTHLQQPSYPKCKFSLSDTHLCLKTPTAFLHRF